MTGTLACQACAARFDIRGGVPRLAGAALEDRALMKAQTSQSFGHLWAQARSGPDAMPSAYHFETMARALSLAPVAGAVLDAGCGEGIDLVNQARRPGVEVIGAELSEGGCETTARRILLLPDAHVVQADLAQLPFDSGQFDLVYCYGVLHHLSVPASGLGELARVARIGAPLAVYLYEDFSDRSAAWRWWLGAANSLRHVTTRMSPRVLYWCCQLGSPLVYLTFTVPYLLLRRVPQLNGMANKIPFRHGKGPWRLTGDLFDRFSAPVEYRYSRESATAFLQSAGLTVVRTANDRGWILLGEVS